MVDITNFADLTILPSRPSPPWALAEAGRILPRAVFALSMAFVLALTLGVI